MFQILAPRLTLIGGGSVAELPAVLRRLGLARPLIVTDPFMVSSGMVRRCLDPLAAAAIAADVFSDTVSDPTDTVVAAGVGPAARGRLRLPDRLRRRIADRYREGDGAAGPRRGAAAGDEGAGLSPIARRCR